MNIQKCPLAIQIQGSVHKIQYPESFTPRQLKSFVLNQFPECLPYIVDYTVKLVYKGRNLLATPDQKLCYLVPSTTRETVVVQFEPDVAKTECSMVTYVDNDKVDQPEVSDILMFSEEEDEDDMSPLFTEREVRALGFDDN